MLLSNEDGWPVNYTVETSLAGSIWSLGAKAEFSDVILRSIRFSSPRNIKQIRPNVTADQSGCTRIAELSPIYAAVQLASNSTSSPSSSSTPSTWQQKSHTIDIIAGVLGLAMLVYFYGY